MAKKLTQSDRASMITFGKKFGKLSTKYEQDYIANLLSRHFMQDRSYGGYGKKEARYIEKGGKIPKCWWMKKKLKKVV